VVPGGGAVVGVRVREDLVAIGARQPAVHEAIELFGGTVEVLGCRHVPTAAPVAGVVVCSAGPFDAAADAGRVARLGRRLAQRGLAVQRYRRLGRVGSASSGGDQSRLDFTSLVDDAHGAAELLRDRCGVERLAFVGARLGALVAARVVRRLHGAPLALWEPVIDPVAAAAEAARGRAVGRSAAAPAGGDAPRIGGSDLLDASEALDVFDTPVGAELVDGTSVGDLLDEMGDRPRPVLLIQTGPGNDLRADYASMVDRVRARHLTIDAVRHPCDGRRAGHLVPAADADPLLEHTAAWLAAQLGGIAA
jgi:hypothetical protein